MIFLKNGCGFKPEPNVCVRDTKVRKFSGFGVRVEKKTELQKHFTNPYFHKALYLNEL
jgi:hypothetical protein